MGLSKLPNYDSKTGGLGDSLYNKYVSKPSYDFSGRKISSGPVNTEFVGNEFRVPDVGEQGGYTSLALDDPKTSNLVNMGGSANAASVAPKAGGFSFSDGVGIANVGLGLGKLFLGFQNYKQQKKALKHNIMDSNRKYESDKTIANNTIGRTMAVDKFYGVDSAVKKIV